jgi:hypothetical protein
MRRKGRVGSLTVESEREMARIFPFSERAARVEAATKALKAAAAHPHFEGRDACIEEFWMAIEAALPPDFDDAYAKLKAGDSSGIETILQFLEADPIFFRSGYLKADLVRFLSRTPLSGPQIERLRVVVLRVAGLRDGREFRRYCRLARRLDAPPFRSELEALLSSDDADIRRRAGWVLDALRA